MLVWSIAFIGNTPVLKKLKLLTTFALCRPIMKLTNTKHQHNNNTNTCMNQPLTEGQPGAVGGWLRPNWIFRPHRKSCPRLQPQGTWAETLERNDWEPATTHRPLACPEGDMFFSINALKSHISTCKRVNYFLTALTTILHHLICRIKKLAIQTNYFDWEPKDLK